MTDTDASHDASDSESKRAAQSSEEQRGLDAEIVRDLEADEEASGARGGGCASSLTRAACRES
jgi:hypothetical protein